MEIPGEPMGEQGPTLVVMVAAAAVAAVDIGAEMDKLT
jgi:hypothetical protein